MLDLKMKASLVRNILGEDDTSPIDIFSLVQNMDKMTLIFHPLGNNISGACFRIEESSIILINSAMSLGRQRFTLAHELYHYYYDERQQATVCDSQMGQIDKHEMEANEFASYLLMPPLALYKAIQNCELNELGHLSLNDVIKLEQYFGISHQAMIYRLSSEDLVSRTEIEKRSGIISQAVRMGYDSALYKASHQKTVLGHYVKIAQDLLDKDIISYGKYEEFLLDAFRTDIVFGEEEEEGEVLD